MPFGSRNGLKMPWLRWVTSGDAHQSPGFQPVKGAGVWPVYRGFICDVCPIFPRLFFPDAQPFSRPVLVLAFYARFQLRVNVLVIVWGLPVSGALTRLPATHLLYCHTCHDESADSLPALPGWHKLH